LFAILLSCANAQVYHDPNEPIADPLTGKVLTSRPTAFGKYLNSKFLNVAAKHNGGKAKAAFSQDFYPIDRAIDGVTTGHEGWAWHGRIDKALAMFEFKQDYRVSRIRLLSGVGRFNDHHVTAFQVWYTNATGYMLPPAVHWFPHYHWQPIVDMQPTTLETVVVGNRVYTNGEEEVVIRFSPVRARAFLLKVDAADSDANNAVVTEFEVFTADADEPNAPIPLGIPEFVDHSWVAPPPKGISWKSVEIAGALPGAQATLLLPAPDTERGGLDVVPYRLWSERISTAGNKSRVQFPLTYLEACKELGFDAAGEMRRLSNGRWFTPLHAKVPYQQYHLKPSKAASYCETLCDQTPIAVEGQGVHVSPNSTCRALEGSEFLFVGDSRMRQHFLATIAYLRGVNLRGYVNPSHPHFYGQQNHEHWHPPGRAESCSSSMPHGFELECAGVTGGQATVCDGRVILRLEETDDRERALKRLEDWMDVRRACEDAGTCPSKFLFIIMSIVIPGIRKFSSAEPIRPLVPLLDVPQYLRQTVGIVDEAWQAAGERSSWFYTGGGRAASAKITLIWSLIEPFAFSQPLHAVHNRNITQLNAETRQQLDVSGIPVIDGFRIAIDRVDCHPDNLHWCSVVQNAKVGILLTFARQIVEKINEEELLVRTREEMDRQSERAQQVAQEILRVEAVEEKRAQDAEKKRKKAAEEARARKKAEEEEERRRKKEKVAEKFAKFQKKAAKKTTKAQDQAPEDETCSAQSPGDCKGGDTASTCSDGSCRPTFEVSGSESFKGRDSLPPEAVV